MRFYIKQQSLFGASFVLSIDLTRSEAGYTLPYNQNVLHKILQVERSDT